MDRSARHHGWFAMGVAVVLLSTAAWTARAEEAEAPPNVSGEAVRLNAGQSDVLEIPWPATRVSVTDPDVADVQLLSPRRLQVQGKRSGTTDLAIWGEEEDQLWRAPITVQADLSDIESALAELFPRSSLAVSQMRGVIVVSGVLNRAEEAEHLRRLMDATEVRYMDMTRVGGVQQVQLQVRMAEVSRQALRTLGVNVAYAGEDFFGGIQLGSSAGPLVPTNIGVPAGTAVGDVDFEFLSDLAVPAPVTVFGGFPRADLEVFLRALQENQYMQILAEPTLVALSGEEATFLAGGEFPVPIAQLGAGTTTEVTIDYREFGVLLRFRPLVLGDGTIRLQIRPEVSELSDVGGVEVLGTRVPSLIKRELETTLELNSGQTFAVAGLIDRSTNARRSEVPGLGRLPVLGPLFRSVRYAEEETELLILVTASLVEPVSTAEPQPVPGVLHRRPTSWELFIKGDIEGRSPPKAGPGSAERIEELGLDQLKGPGAWVEHRPALTGPELHRTRSNR